MESSRKSRILKPLNGGRALELAWVNGRRGVLMACRGGKKVMYTSDPLPRDVRADDVIEPLTLALPSEYAYEEEECVIGGVGRTLRWRVVLPPRGARGGGAVHVLDVMCIHDVGVFEDLVRSLHPFAFVRGTYKHIEGFGMSVQVEVPDTDKVAMVAAKFHTAGYGAVLENVEPGKLGVERLDRSKHSWWNQDEATAGPLRDMHRWRYPWCKWKRLPFNWHLLARNCNLPTALCGRVPQPLRNYILAQRQERVLIEAEILHREGLDTAATHASLCKELTDTVMLMSETHFVTARLTDEQSRQLLCATYYIYVAPFDANMLSVANLVVHMYSIHGYYGREIGGYCQDARHLGHGQHVRRFKNKRQYDHENLSTEMKNKVLRIDGSLKGDGFKGTRGRRRREGVPQYRPKSRLLRTREHEDGMRAQQLDCFLAYREEASAADA
jgi:hypothetical protein